MAAGDIVQQVASDEGEGPIDLTFAGPVAVGNTLVVIVTTSLFGGDREALAPDGWSVAIDTKPSAGNVWVKAFYRIAVSTSPEISVEVDNNGDSADFASGVAYELEGTCTLDGATLAYVQSGSSRPGGSLVPTAVGCRALAGIGCDVSGSASASAGWTQAPSADDNQFVKTFGARRNALTSDTSTNIAPTFSGVASNDHTGVVTLLFAPQASSGAGWNYYAQQQ